ncbi:MAG: asparagine synthase (glutamine-hydrolyzing) [Lachnospiraceae bacterium]
MCGILGFCNRKITDDREIKKMSDAILHRGPDDYGCWHDEHTGIWLGHRRLSILDLSKAGAQPMISKSERYVMVYNGEIYNIEVLRKKLLEERHITSFKGTSDTEVLLEGIAAYGYSVLDDLKGMFGAAVYDREEKTLTLFRDRVGEKPLYYGFVRGNFVFASDLLSIKAMTDFQNKINKEALALFLRLGYLPTPYSIYEDIYKLEPGKMLKIAAPFINIDGIETYYSMEEVAKAGEKNPFKGSFQEAKEELKRLLTNSIEQQMIADVPVGAFLSGGIDSPLIVSIMQSLRKEPVKTFTMGFEDPKYNEALFAKEIAAHIGTDHTELYVTEKELQEVIPKLPHIFSEPFADSSQLPTYLVSKLAKSKVTVSLSGDAGDELFCGYNTYYKCDNLWNKVKKVPYPLRNAMGKAVSVTPFVKNGTIYRGTECLMAKNSIQLKEAVCNRMDYYSDHIVNGITLPLNKEIPILQDNKQNMLLKDMCYYHPEDILVKVDRAGMEVSLENRIPLLDQEIIQFAWSLPIDYKYKDGVSKVILKELLYEYVPKEMLDRPKKGFSVPIKNWLQQGSVHEYAFDLLEKSKLVEDGFLEKRKFQKVLQEFHNKGIHSGLLWKLFVAEQWYREK